MADRSIDAAAIRDAVELLFGRLLADPFLAPVFGDVDLARLKAHQRAFLAQSLGGSAHYTGRDMRSAHEGLGITDQQFARMLVHLIASLREVGVAEDVVERAASDIEALRSLVVEAAKD